jgi:UDP-N-acetylmuramoyl-L-alanyl-D-glutamate--2,6-diaminopimelate ligase
VTLDDVVAALGTLVVAVDGDRAAPTTGIAYDSRRVVPGTVFVALKGLKADGLDFVPQAVTLGASVVVSEQPRPASVQVPWVVVRDGRLSLALLGAAVHRHPSREIPVVGVTGTNGKTTTTYLLAAVLDAAGLSAGVLGTVHYKIGREEREAARTTPEASDVQALLRGMIDAGNRSCVMEVSSHALALKRVDGVRFAAAVFTNLTRDHLDFHADMESYFAAKRRLFTMLAPTAPGIINADDPRAATLVATCGRSITYGVQKPADVRPERLEMNLDGVRFTATTPAGPVEVRSALVGRPNVYNLLATVATASALGVPGEAITAGLASQTGVPGRFEVVSTPSDGVTVVVDYAHTDDALRNLIETARPLTGGRVITVFGCGGDRDRTKRPLMGMVAARLSDVVIITSDNPRSEDPQAIIEEIRRGIPAGEAASDRTPDVTAIVDRAAAIDKAVSIARPGDVVLVAGKGHEKTQHIGDRVLRFDDADEGALARHLLGGRPRRRRARPALCRRA